MSDCKKTTMPAWKPFDECWYRRRYQHVLSSEEQKANQTRLAELWETQTVHQGRSPNCFFDEEWYLQANANLQRSIYRGGIFETGFQHYCDIGYRYSTPHWLFSEEIYFRNNPDLSFNSVIQNGCTNGYDHFIKYGDKERRFISPFFNHDIFINNCLKENIHFDFSHGAFAQYLSLDISERGMVRSSWYFDPHWYISCYPQVQDLLDNGSYITPLHHYLCNTQASQFNPTPYFSEIYYLERYPDIREAVEQGHIRNGYEHFIRFGAMEKRQPHPEVDLGAFASHFESLKNTLHSEKVADIFALWIKYKEESISLYKEENYENYKIISIERVKSLLPSIFRFPLVFEEWNKTSLYKPSISVIVISMGDYLSSLATISSLHEQNIPFLQVIVVSNGNEQEQRLLEQASTGITLVFPEQWLSSAELVQKGLYAAQADTVLFLYAGAQPLYGALHAMVNNLKNHEAAGGGGQILAVDSYVKEAGCRLWRDGSITAYGKGQKPYAPGISFLRHAEAFHQAAFFGRRKALQKIWPHVIICGLDAGFRTISVALRAAGESLIYVPEFLVRDLESIPQSSCTADEIKSCLQRSFPHFLTQHALPPQTDCTVQHSPEKPVAVFVCPTLPRYKEGGPARRFFEKIHAMRVLGWSVTVIGLREGAEDKLTIPLDYPADVECLAGLADMAAFLKARQGSIALLWIVGTEIFSHLFPVLESHTDFLSTQSIILDTVALDGRGLRAMENHLRRLVGAQDDQEQLLRDAAHELTGASFCQCILATDEEEAEIIRRVGYSVVRVLPSCLPHSFMAPDYIPDFSSRHDILFTLPIYQSGDPGHDAFDWFCLTILPYLRDLLPEDVVIWVGGYHHDTINLGFYDRFARIEGIVQPVPYETLLKQCRILIAPARVMNAHPLELLEAAEYGLPIILGAVLHDRLGWQDGEEVRDAGFNNPEHFAKVVADLYTDEALWKKLSHNARARVRRNYTYAHFQESLRDLLVLVKGTSPLDCSEPLTHQFEPNLLRRGAGKGVSVTDNDKTDHDDDEQEDDTILKIRLGVSLDTH